jgi:hypothetical protein
MLNSFAIASKIDIQLGEVPKGQEKNVKKAHFIQVNIFQDKILLSNCMEIKNNLPNLTPDSTYYR